MRRWITICEAALTQAEIDDLKPHLRPAVKVNGKLHVGRRGQPHDHIFNTYYPRDINNPDLGEHDERGFYDPRTKKWYADEDLPGLDATDLMTRAQRIRTFGHESVERDHLKKL